MAETTRDSYQDTKNYVEVTFQRRKDVLDSELNEMQRITRSQLAKSLVSLLGDRHAVSNNDGGRVTSDGVTANQIIIKSGFLVAVGYAVFIGADLTVSGLTTPGAPRTDDVWLGISEGEVNSASDPLIAVQKLGETTVRKQAVITITVDQGGASPPVSSATPYNGGIQYVHLARIYRTAVATVAAATVVDFRSRSLAQLMAQDRNVMVRGTGISWDGTTLVFGTLGVRLPGEATGSWSVAGLSVAPADGNAVGWLSSTAANRLRRRIDVASIGHNATPSATADNIATLVAFSALTAVTGQFAHDVFVIGMRDGTQIVLRDGSVLNAGDYMHAWGTPGGVQTTAEVDLKPLQQYRTHLGKVRSLIDHSGFRMGQISEVDEHWMLSSTRTLFVSSITGQPGGGAAPAVGTGWIGREWRLMTNGGHMDVQLGPFPVGSTIAAAVVFYDRADATVVYGIQDKKTDGSAPTSVITKQISAGTGPTSTDLSSGSLAGALPYTLTALTVPMLNATMTTAPVGGHDITGVQLTVITDPPGWNFAPGSTVQADQVRRTYDQPVGSSSINQRAVTLTTSIAATVAATGVVTMDDYESVMDADIDYVQEWVCSPSTNGAGGTAIHVYSVGVQNSNGGANNRFVYFHSDTSTTEWMLRIVGSATSDALTGVVAVGGTRRMRIEIKGSNVASVAAGSFRVRGFIDGVMVANVVTATMPTNGRLRPYIQCGNTGSAGGANTCAISVGRIRRCWNHLLTQDSL